MFINMFSLIKSAYKKFRNSKSYFIKIYKLFICSQVFIILISVVMYIYLRNLTLDEIVQYNFGVISSTSDAIESNFSELTQLSFLLMKDLNPLKDINMYQNLNSNDISNIKLIKDSLNTIQSIKNCIKNIFVYSEEKKILIENSGNFNHLQFFNYFNRYESYDVNYWNNYLVINNASLCALPTSKLFVGYPSKKYEYKIEKVVPFVVSCKSVLNLDAIITLNVDEQYINSLIDNYKSSEHNEIVILDSKGNLISNTKRISEFQAYYPDLIKCLDADHDLNIVYKNVTMNGDKFIVFSKRIPLIDWFIFSLIPKHEFYAKTILILKYLVLIDTVLILITLFGAYIFSNHLYSPINNLLEILYSPLEVQNFHKDTDEFALIRNKLGLLREENENLNKNIDELTPVLLEKFFHSLIQHDLNIKKDKEYQEFYKNYKVMFDKRYFLITVFQLLYSKRFIETLSKNELTSLKIELFDLLKNITNKKFEKTIFIKIDQDSFYIVANLKSPNERQTFHKLVQEINLLFCNDTDFIKMNAVVGRITDDLYSLPSVFKEANELIKHRDLAFSSNIYDIESNDMDIKSYTLKYNEEKISNVLIDGDYKKLRNVIESVFNKNFAYSHPVCKIKNLIQLFFHTCEMLLIRIGVNKSLIDDLIDIGEFTFFSLEETKQSLLQALENIRLLVQENIKSKENNMEDYIKTHYKEPNLCLEKMAFDYNISPNYLSKVFREQVGQNFTDYLAMVRIDKAKDLLLSTNLTIEEICDKIGIVSRSTFNRIFNKYTGIAPGKYRLAKKINLG